MDALVILFDLVLQESVRDTLNFVQAGLLQP